MIRTLRVRNLAVIEELDLELAPGLNVLTGETGAGKSVLLDAVALLSGRRVGADRVRTGAERATVEAIFHSERLLERAAELGLADPRDEELLIVRQVSREGRSKVYVNGTLATLSLLSQLLDDAVEVISQGQHQRLLHPDVQTGLLDEFAELTPQAAQLRGLYDGWRALAERIHERRAHAEESARREDQLRFELEQIRAVDPQPGELETLEAEHARLAHVDRLGQEIAGALEQIDVDGGARERLAKARDHVRRARQLDASLGPLDDTLERAQLELEDASLSAQSYVDLLEADPGRLGQLEIRLADLRRLQDRYGSTVEAILSHRDTVQAELASLGGGEARTRELEAEQAERAEALGAAAEGLSRARQAAAGALADAVGRELAELDLGRAVFAVELEPLSAKTREGWPAPCSPNGRERAVYRLAANPGEESRRLRDAASGGERARILLALRNVLRDETRGGLLLFDEVDAGISGRTAGRVGERLRSLAKRHQIVCITHLPQIAALAQTHYRVEKRVRQGRTRTRVLRLEGEARVEEIARMASGGRVSAAARAHARDLLGR